MGEVSTERNIDEKETSSTNYLLHGPYWGLSPQPLRLDQNRTGDLLVPGLTSTIEQH